MAAPVTYFDIGCQDHEATCKFFQDVFGWELAQFGPSARAAAGEGGIPGAITSLGHEPHQYVMVYMEVEDIPATLAAIEAAGGATVIPETPIPDGGTFAWFTDPGGNTLGLHCAAKAD